MYDRTYISILFQLEHIYTHLNAFMWYFLLWLHFILSNETSLFYGPAVLRRALDHNVIARTDLVPGPEPHRSGMCVTNHCSTRKAGRIKESLRQGVRKEVWIIIVVEVIFFQSNNQPQLRKQHCVFNWFAIVCLFSVLLWINVKFEKGVIKVPKSG